MVLLSQGQWLTMAKFVHCLEEVAKPTCNKFSAGQRSNENLMCFYKYKVGVAETLQDFRDFFFCPVVVTHSCEVMLFHLTPHLME